eukprot:gnl/TRDRNA2_/TRDRNA2_6082_c0_seq1.p2 gnl/TRDRNA2_/TRDRNA2_6082_c0~~gnl/TRDRNA2_/TRDRNA2_6082_c0_seq1.p2  ORF type:complete len:110 (+),score=19.77 gnl/TRDRNA2_/TRDRNA2_6082_c0_seq1:176-505(+)
MIQGETEDSNFKAYNKTRELLEETAVLSACGKQLAKAVEGGCSLAIGENGLSFADRADMCAGAKKGTSGCERPPLEVAGVSALGSCRTDITMFFFFSVPWHISAWSSTV